MDVRARFRELADAARRDAPFDLCEAALLVAAEDGDDVDLDGSRAAITALRERAAEFGSGAASPLERLERLNHLFFEELGFRGNRDEYYDPRNSFLHEVVERRTGIPITLSILYCELAEAIGLEARGVGFPGHFLVRVAEAGRPTRADELGSPTGPWMVDAFSAQLLDREGCEGLLRHFLGARAELRDEVLDPARPADVVFRLLSNLKQIYLQGERFEAMLACCERLLLLAPDDPVELRDRGLVLNRLECPGPALADFERFLELAEDHPSAPAVRRLVAELRSDAPSLH